VKFVVSLEFKGDAAVPVDFPGLSPDLCLVNSSLIASFGKLDAESCLLF